MKTEPHMTLYQLNRLVRRQLEIHMPGEYWVEAELSECRESRGHCYLELVQNDERSATPVARASARCWASRWAIIRPYFERTTGQQLHAGMKVLLKVCPQFHEAYGFSWIVSDIDPTFTLGDMARRRQDIIRQLKQEGVFDLQRELSLPLFCQRVAVISSETAAGYGDFCHQLRDNPYGFVFSTWLFPAVMQGEGVEESIVSALDRINADIDSFDCVAIIRGGGATSDMSGFDTLALAENVANFPLPIITGIGHDRDESIIDMVSHTRVKTPTAAAAFLIASLKSVLDMLNDAQDAIARTAQQRLLALRGQLDRLAEAVPRLFSVVRTRQEARLDALFAQAATQAGRRLQTSRSRLEACEQRLPLVVERRLANERHRLELAEQRVKGLDPMLLLHRGYSITLKDGKAVRDPALLRAGDEIETRVEKGNIKSVIV